MSKHYEVTPLKGDDSRGWEVQIDGQPVDASSLVITNSNLGVNVSYGMRPEGYDGVVIRERGGGGSVTVPYTRVDDELYVGMVLEERKTIGSYVWNVPRGFLDAGERHEDAAVRELQEETGAQAKTYGSIILLASGINANSAFFDTNSQPNEPNAGVRFYALEVDGSALEPTNNGYKFRENIPPVDPSRTAERIVTARFKPLHEAMNTNDMFSLAAIGCLVTHLAIEELNRTATAVPQLP